DPTLEEVIIKTIRAFLRFGDVFHVEIKPKNSRDRPAPSIRKDCRQDRRPHQTGRRSAHSEPLWHFTCHVEVIWFDSAERNLHSSKQLTKARARGCPVPVYPFRSNLLQSNLGPVHCGDSPPS